MASNRISEKDLQNLLARINEITNSPRTPYNGVTRKSNIGHYMLDCAYGGYNVARIVSDGGGITKPLGNGYHPKRVIYDRLYSFMLGLETRKNQD